LRRRGRRKYWKRRNEKIHVEKRMKTVLEEKKRENSH